MQKGKVMNQTSDLFVVAVLAIIVKNGKLLAMKRSKNKKVAPGVWEVVSGRLEHGEIPLEGLKREIEEETTLKVQVQEAPFDVYVTRYGEAPMLALVYQANYIEGEVKLSEEHEAFEWMDMETFSQKCPLKKLVHSMQKINL